MLAVYVTGHGFGHATRTAEVLRLLRAREPRLAIAVRTTAPATLFDGVGGPLTVGSVECDVGLVQRDALTIDEPATAAALQSFLAGWEARVAAEVRFLRESGARLVLGDIPPLAFAAAAEAGHPSIALGNFSWDWIYRHIGRRHPLLLEGAEAAARAYRRAGLLLRLPFAGDLSAFPRIEDIPLVARKSKLAKAESRRRLGLDARPVVLLSFGGLGMPELDPTALGRLGEYQFLLAGQAGAGEAPNLLRVAAADLTAAGLGHVDLVGAADVVVSKPGYGIVSECIANGTPLLYTSRGRFVEYDVFVAGMPRVLRCRYLDRSDLLAGRWAGAVRALLAQLPPPETARVDGAQVAAEEIFGLIA